MAHKKYRVKMDTPFTEGVISALRIGCLAGIAICGFMYYQQLSGNGGQMGGCSESLPCNEVFGSKWGDLLGVPVTLIGVITYVLLFLLSLDFVRKGRSFADVLIGALGLSLVIGAIWFIALQITYEVPCKFCMVAQVINLAIGGIIVQAVFKAVFLGIKVPAVAICFLGLLLPLALIGGQLSGDGPTLAQEDEDEDGESLAGDGTQGAGSGFYHFPTAGPEPGLKIKKGDFPTIGNFRANKAVIMMIDYSAPSSQSLHKYINDLLNRLGDRLAVVIIPVPADSKVNAHWGSINAESREIAALALAAWETSPRVYKTYHDFLIQKGEVTQLGSVAGAVWADKNSNGIHDADENGIVDVHLDLIVNGSLTGKRSRTDESGAFVFSNLKAPLDGVSVRVAKSSFEIGGALNGLIGTAGIEKGRQNESARRSLTTLAPQIRDMNFGFIASGSYDASAIVPVVKESGPIEVISLDYLDRARDELKRLADDQFAEADALIPKNTGGLELGVKDEGEEGSEDDVDPWRDRTNRLIDKLITGTELYGQLGGARRLPKIIYGDGVIRDGRLEGTEKEFARKVAKASELGSK